MAIKIKKPPKIKVPKAEIVVADRIDLVLLDINRQMKGVGRIDRGRDISYLDPPRIRTGILGLDIVSNGGLPRGGIVEFWGPKSSSKTTSAFHVMREEQRRGNHVAFAAGEGFSKTWARHNGLWIPYSDAEYESTDESDHEQMRAYDAWGVENGMGTVCVLQHVHGDGLLEMVAQVVKANIFAVVVVDSLAVLKNSRQLGETPAGGRMSGEKAVTIGDEDRGGGGQIQMFNRFMNRIFSAMNTRYSLYNDEGKKDPNGTNMMMDMDGLIMNQTCLICLNQARQKGISGAGGRGMGIQYQPVGGEGLRHFFQFSAFFRRGEEIGDNQMFDGDKRWTHWAIEATVKGTKSKIGPEGKFANWHLYIDDHAPFEKGQIDRAREVRVWGVEYEVIQQKGAFYSYLGHSIAQGKENVDEVLREDPDLQREIEDEIIKRCRAA